MPMTWPNSPTVGQLHQPNGSTGPTYVFLGSIQQVDQLFLLAATF